MGGVGFDLVHRHIPGLRFRGVARDGGGPEFNPPGLVLAIGEVDRGIAIAAEAIMGGLVLEDTVDTVQHRRGRAERMQQLRFLHRRIGPARQVIELAFDPRQAARISPLKAVDRLFLVADDEERAMGLPRAVPGEELLGNRTDDAPLFGGGILRLVHQNVIDTAIEFKAHPVAGIGLGEQLSGKADQVVEIERVRLGLQGADLPQQGNPEPGDGLAGGKGVEGALAGSESDKAVGEIGAERFGPRQRLLCGSGRKALAGRAGLGQHRRAQGRDQGTRVFIFQRTQQIGGNGLFMLAAGLKSARQFSQGIKVKTGQRLDGGGLVRVLRPDAERLGHPRDDVIGGAVESRALVDDLGNKRVDAEFLHPVDDENRGVSQGCIAALQRETDGVVACFGQQFSGGNLVQQFEMGRDFCLKRKAAQQAFAEGVDGLDFQPAGGFQRLREKLPRAFERNGIAPAGVQLTQGIAQGEIFHQRPSAEAREQLVLHIGGGGAGIGEA